MKHKMSIKLRDNSMPFFEIDKDKFQVKPSKNEDIFFEADSVKLMDVGAGILTASCGNTQIGVPLDRIAFYRVEDVEDDA